MYLPYFKIEILMSHYLISFEQVGPGRFTAIFDKGHCSSFIYPVVSIDSISGQCRP